MDTNERVNDTYTNKVLPDEEPVFYGTRRVDFDKLSNGEEIRSAILNKLTQTIETQLRKANRQFGEYRVRNPRKNSLSVCLLLNSQIDEFSPDVVVHSLHRKMKPTDDGVRFPHIDAVIYISEKHFQQLPDGRIAFAIIAVIGVPAIEHRWKAELVDLVTQKWSEFRTGAGPVSGRSDQFESVDDIPDTMRRHEARKLAYERNPYLRTKTHQQLKVYFQRCVALNSLAFIKGSWPKPNQEETGHRMRLFTDALNEINCRKLDMRQFDPRTLSREERLEVYAGLPEELVEMLTNPPSP